MGLWLGLWAASCAQALALFRRISQTIASFSDSTNLNVLTIHDSKTTSSRIYVHAFSNGAESHLSAAPTGSDVLALFVGKFGIKRRARVSMCRRGGCPQHGHRALGVGERLEDG